MGRVDQKTSLRSRISLKNSELQQHIETFARWHFQQFIVIRNEFPEKEQKNPVFEAILVGSAVKFCFILLFYRILG